MRKIKMKHLRSLSTRELLSYMKKARKYGGKYSPVDSNAPFSHMYFIDELKEVLKDREHIPNKNEAKELRRLKKKRGR